MTYYLFAGNNYDDEIGMFAYRGAFGTPEEAFVKHKEGNWDIGQLVIVDLETHELKTAFEYRYPKEGDPEYKEMWPSFKSAWLTETPLVEETT